MKTRSGKATKVANLALGVGKTRELHHRGSNADLGVLKQMFQDQDYSFQRLSRGQELMSLYQSLKRPLIVDAGANIGASAVWFALNFPGSHILAVEPDGENVELLRANTQGLDVDIRKAALGSVDGKVSVEDPGIGEWGYRTRADKNGKCDMISITRAIGTKIKEGYTPFIVKIDIEGGEDNIFKEATDWVDSIPVIIIEVHDWLLPKQGTSKNFLKCISQYDRDFILVGENIFSIKN